MPSRTATRNAIADAAYRRAQQSGIGSLNVRGIAADCGVSVGTVYNCFPDKASLVTEVIREFWENAAFGGSQGVCFDYRPGENLIGYCKRVAAGLGDALSQFREDWLVEISSLDGKTRQSGLAAEKRCFAHIEKGLAMAARNDPGIAPEARERIDASGLSHFIWTNMLASLKEGDRTCRALFALLELALYR